MVISKAFSHQKGLKTVRCSSGNQTDGQFFTTLLRTEPESTQYGQKRIS